jgi:hypothetical protein
VNLPAGKADPISSTPVTVRSGEAVSVRNDTARTMVNTVINSVLQENIIKNDTLKYLIDSLRQTGMEGDSTVIDSLQVLSDSLTTLTDSAQSAPDSIPADTAKRKGALEATVEYESKDSIVWTADNMAYIFGDGNVKYQNIELKAAVIQMNMDSSLLYATHSVDSLGEETGFPVFSEGEQDMEAREMRYNFKTRKATARHVVTKQGEGFVIADITKKMPNDVLNMEGGKYTTCDAEHPHFYINMTKSKVRPGKDIVAGPVWMVIEDVPLFPLVLPFAFFPFTDSYSSGILMPTYGDEMSRGFFLRNGGYYFALSDYFDFTLTGELYTKGSWGLSGQTSYRKRYKYSGNFDASYLTTVTGDKGLPDYSKSNAFKIRWSHSQDPKANPYRTISASVDFSTNSYDRNQLNSLYTSAATQNNKGSSINMTQRFPNKPFSISATMNINQRSQDSSVSVTLPDVTLTLSRIYPFKRKNPIGNERWYEKISMSYTGTLRNNIQTKENKLFNSSLIKDWTNGMQHTIPISATYTLLDYINISPSVNYTERWYTHKTLQEYDFEQRRLVPTDTVYGFYRVYNYSASVSASTTLYGMYTMSRWNPMSKLFRVIRHRFDTSVSYSMTPDFGDPKYGYYNNYVALDGTNTPTLGAPPREMRGSYSPFDGQLFGAPGRGKSGSINISVDNNIEAKMVSSRDSTGEVKISLIDKLSGNMSYNMAADSLRWSDLSTAVRIKFGKLYTLNLNMSWDTYTYIYDDFARRAIKVNKTRWEAGKGFGRLRSTGTAFSYTLNNDTFKKLFGGGDDTGKKKGRNEDDYSEDENYDPNDPFAENNLEEEEPVADKSGGSLLNRKKRVEGEYDEDGYYVSSVPWSISFSYSLSLSYNQNDFDREKLEYKYQINNALSFNGNIQPTKNWRINFNATYDWDAKKISYMTCNISRTMHCWQMSASIIPIGPLKSYSFSISANASMLRDLKYDQSSTPYNGQNWY